MLNTVLRNNMPNVLNDKKLLVVIVTDGEPTNVVNLYLCDFKFYYNLDI